MSKIDGLLRFLEANNARKSGNDFAAELSPANAGDSGWLQVSELIGAYKAFWRAVPLAVFERNRMDVRPHAASMSQALLESVKRDDIARIAVLLKRLRRYVLLGRYEAPLTRAKFLLLLRLQKNHCATCGHTFSSADLQAREYTEELGAESQTAGLRPPHVDHVVPIFLGGNRQDNLQILCSRCNLGKGSAIAWPFKAAIIRPLRPSELLEMGAGLRWMTLERDKRCLSCSRAPIGLQASEELVVDRRDPGFGWMLENTRTDCTACRGSCMTV